MRQQPPPAHPNTPPQGAREFGGEQAKNVEYAIIILLFCIRKFDGF